MTNEAGIVFVHTYIYKPTAKPNGGNRKREQAIQIDIYLNRYYVTKSKNDGIMILDFFFAYMVKGLPNMSIITS